MPYEAVNDTLYTIAAEAKGGREGAVRSEDGVVDLPLGKPGSTANPKANPETLFAAGYAACFSGALSAVARAEGVDVGDAPVEATVTFGRTDSGFGLAVDLTADLSGLPEADALALLEKAHAVCPYSKATRGNIDVRLHLA